MDVAESFCSVRDIRYADPFLVVIIPSFCSVRDESGENRRIVADKSASMLFTSSTLCSGKTQNAAEVEFKNGHSTGAFSSVKQLRQ